MKSTVTQSTIIEYKQYKLNPNLDFRNEIKLTIQKDKDFVALLEQTKVSVDNLTNSIIRAKALLPSDASLLGMYQLKENITDENSYAPLLKMYESVAEPSKPWHQLPKGVLLEVMKYNITPILEIAIRQCSIPLLATLECKNYEPATIFKEQILGVKNGLKLLEKVSNECKPEEVKEFMREHPDANLYIKDEKNENVFKKLLKAQNFGAFKVLLQCLPNNGDTHQCLESCKETIRAEMGYIESRMSLDMCDYNGNDASSIKIYEEFETALQGAINKCSNHEDISIL
jgi:hypothetical protein